MLTLTSLRDKTGQLGPLFSSKIDSLTDIHIDFNEARLGGRALRPLSAMIVETMKQQRENPLKVTFMDARELEGFAGSDPTTPAICDQSASAKPRFYVGLPVYNGENYVAEAIDSILSQTLGDFELIISDNASTDGTEEICREFVKKDARVRYTRNDTNCGAAWNFNRVFELSAGEYFMWAAHDDKYTPDYARKCIEMLDTDPSIVLCYTRAIDIDEHGKQLKMKDHTNNSDSEIPHERFKKLISLSYTCEAMFGVIRSSILKKTQLHGSYADSDRVLLSELGLYGRFHVIPEYLFLHREHPLRSIRQFPARHQRTAWFNPKNAGKIVLPHFRELAEFIRGVNRSDVARRERWRCYGHLGRWLISNRKRLFWDIKGAVKQMRGES